MSIVHYSARFLLLTLQQLLNSVIPCKNIAIPVVVVIVSVVVVVVVVVVVIVIVVVVVVNGRSSKKLLHYECGKI